MTIYYMNQTIKDFDSYGKHLKFCKATNTRLMGVVFLHARWELTKNMKTIYLDQFFYFDAEEYGFDTYKEVISSNPNFKNTKEEIQRNVDKMGGCLGGKLVDLNLKEFKALLNYYYNFSKERGDIIPGPDTNYKFLLDGTTLNNKELYNLYQKICVDIANDYELIHYYMMRLIGKDFTPLSYLSSNFIDLKDFEKFEQGALFREDIQLIEEHSFSKNIDQYELFSKEKTYKVTSIVMIDDVNHKLISTITIKDNRISKIALLSDVILIHSYAEDLINRKEYIVEYVFDSLPPTLDIESKLTRKSMLNIHDYAKTYMIFNDNNHHVREKTYLISNDTFGTYYISDFGSVLIRTTEEKNIEALKDDLLSSNLGNYLEYVSTYEDDKQAFLEYIYSGEISFSVFMDEYEK